MEGPLGAISVVGLFAAWFVTWRWQVSYNRRHAVGLFSRTRRQEAANSPVTSALVSGDYGLADRLAKQLLDKARATTTATTGVTAVHLSLIGYFTTRASVGDEAGARKAAEEASEGISRALSSGMYRNDRGLSQSFTVLRNALDRELARTPLNPESIRKFYISGEGD